MEDIQITWFCSARLLKADNDKKQFKIILYVFRFGGYRKKPLPSRGKIIAKNS